VDEKKISHRIRGRALQKLRLYWFMAKPLCVACEQRGKVSMATELDHIVPLHKGGTNEEPNLQGLCSECHDEKTRKDLGWRERITIGSDGWPIESYDYAEKKQSYEGGTKKV